ncbi:MULTISPECIES: restriction endonuclease subunit S [unclassified Pannonibacter]|uniref:restriction endonuclease subunit S n=1 Tax=unclassified Pannonibacter TaxID=2627228 RepID=UPI0016483A7A|nr:MULTISPECIES: restriction endonuclease subunit S [unclassified Pannonibacter]
MSGLPKGWEKLRLKEIVKEGGGTIDPRAFPDETFDLFSIPSFSEGLPERVLGIDIGSTKQLVQQGDVLLSKIVPHIRRVWVVPKANDRRQIASGEWIVYRSSHLEPHFIRLALSERSFRASFLGTVSGVGGSLMRASPKQVAEFSVPLPPLAEQKRIVAKLEALNAKSARARTELARIETLVSRYKQAVLSKAFSGELTRDWREKVDVNLEWEEKTIAEVARIASGQTPKGIESVLHENGEVLWFKVSSMNEAANLGGLRHSQFCLSYVDAQKIGLKIYPVGSIAFPKRGGAIATNKKRKLQVPAALDLNLMVLIATDVDIDFLWWWTQKLDLSTISNGSNVPQINNGDIAPLPILVPTLEEQHEIVRRIESAFAKIDRLAAEAKRALALVGRLDEAVLAKAFRGELVPQDENDDPAATLLARLRTEREAAPKVKRGRKARS